MSLRDELVREYKSLLSSLGEVETVAGETDLLNLYKTRLGTLCKMHRHHGEGKTNEADSSSKICQEKHGENALHTR